MYLGQAHDDIMYIGSLDIDTKSKSVLMYLMICKNSKNGKCFPSMASICSFTSLSIRSVQRSIKDLEQLGLLRVERGTGHKTSQYQVDFATIQEPKAAQIGTPEVSQRHPRGAKQPPVTIEVTKERTKELINKNTTYSCSQPETPMGISFDEWMTEDMGEKAAIPYKLARTYAENIERVEEKTADRWSRKFCILYYHRIREMRFPDHRFEPFSEFKMYNIMKCIERSCEEFGITVKDFIDNAVMNWHAIKEKYKSRANAPEYLVINHFRDRIAEDASKGGTKSRAHRISETQKDKNYEELW